MNKNKKIFIYIYNILIDVYFIIYMVLFFTNKTGFSRQKTLGYTIIPIFIFIIFSLNLFSFLYLYKKNKVNLEKYDNIYKKIYKPSSFYTSITITFAVLFTVFISFGKIDGKSMENTFHDNDIYITYTYNIKVKHNDFIVLNAKQNNNEHLIIKRLIALKDDKIELEKDLGSMDKYFIKVNNNYVKDIKNNKNALFFDYEVERIVKDIKKVNENNYIIDTEKYLVIGDNFLNSKDSRTYGLFEYKDLVSKILFK